MKSVLIFDPVWIVAIDLNFEKYTDNQLFVENTFSKKSCDWMVFGQAYKGWSMFEREKQGCVGRGKAKAK